MKLIPLFLITAILTGCTATPNRHQQGEDDIEAILVAYIITDWHHSAQWGMFDLYFDAMTDDAVFLGTDASERWTKSEFMGYAREPFADGHGWTYTPSDQQVAFSADRQTAWIDELLTNEKYGTLRGTGVLVKVGDKWKIAHYSLTMLVPNEKMGAVVEVIGAP